MLDLAPLDRIERGEPRQFDFSFKIVLDDTYCVQLAVECKNIFPGAPLVVSGTARNELEAYHEIIASFHGTYGENQIETRHGAGSKTLRVRRSAWYPATEFVGKSVGKMKPPKDKKYAGPLSGYVLTNDSEVYDPWSQAVANAAALAKRAMHVASRQRSPSVFTVTLPIVVIPDETLWQLQYDEQGAYRGDAQAAQSCPVYRDQSFALETQEDFAQSWRCSHFEFRTISGLRELIKKLKSQDSWALWFDRDVIGGFHAKFR